MNIKTCMYPTHHHQPKLDCDLLLGFVLKNEGGQTYDIGHTKVTFSAELFAYFSLIKPFEHLVYPMGSIVIADNRIKY